MKNKKKERELQEPQELLSVQELLDNLIEDYSGLMQKEVMNVRRNLVTREAFLGSAAQYLGQTYGNRSMQCAREQAIREFEQYIFGYYRLQGLLDDKEISDIRIVAWDNIRFKKKGHRYTSGVRFRSGEEYGRFVEFVAAKNQVNLSSLNAIQTFVDDITHPAFILRFTISTALVDSSRAPYIHIRKISRNFPEMKQLQEEKVFPAQVGELLVRRARQGSLFICGQSGAGKTILLNALKEEAILPDRSCGVIQQNGELTTKRHPEMLFFHTVENRGEGRITYSLEELSTAALLMDFDYIIVGETKGAEALDLLNASYTGHLCMATGHGASAEEALDKVMVNAKKKSDLPGEVLLRMLMSFRTIVFMEDYKVVQVSEVAGWSEEKKRIEYRRLYDASMEGEEAQQRC